MVRSMIPGGRLAPSRGGGDRGLLSIGGDAEVLTMGGDGGPLSSGAAMALCSSCGGPPGQYVRLVSILLANNKIIISPATSRDDPSVIRAKSVVTVSYYLLLGSPWVGVMPVTPHTLISPSSLTMSLLWLLRGE